MFSRKFIKLLNKDKLFFSIILTIVAIFLFKNYSKIFHKVEKLTNTGKKILAIKKIPPSNCDFDYIKKVPLNSSVIIGHIYGRVSKDSIFIDKKAEEFLITNKSNIKNLFLTGDIFSTPSKEKWTKFYNLFDKHMKILITPGNHDIGQGADLKMFKESVNQSTDFPIIYEENNNIFIFENSIKSGWHIQKNTLEEIKKINENRQVFLLRHNIASRELIPLANSKALLKGDLPDSKKIENLLNRNIFIISGDGGAFKYLPKFYCRREGKITFIINGLGGFLRDEILIINKKQIHKYKLY